MVKNMFGEEVKDLSLCHGADIEKGRCVECGKECKVFNGTKESWDQHFPDKS